MTTTHKHHVGTQQVGHQSTENRHQHAQRKEEINTHEAVTWIR